MPEEKRVEPSLAYKLSNSIFRFGNKVRLNQPRQYKKVFINPVKSSDSLFLVLAIKNSHTHPRLGLIVAKKQVGYAVARNVIKRIVRESFRLHQQHALPLDIVVLARRNCTKTTNNELRKSLHKHWETVTKKFSIH